MRGSRCGRRARSRRVAVLEAFRGRRRRFCCCRRHHACQTCKSERLKTSQHARRSFLYSSKQRIKHLLQKARTLQDAVMFVIDFASSSPVASPPSISANDLPSPHAEDIQKGLGRWSTGQLWGTASLRRCLPRRSMTQHDHSTLKLNWWAALIKSARIVTTKSFRTLVT